MFHFFQNFCFPRKTPAKKQKQIATTLAQEFFSGFPRQTPVSPENPGKPRFPRKTPANPGKPRQQKITTLAQELFSGFPQQTPVSPENPGTTNKK